jgi:hypothetical protein
MILCVLLPWVSVELCDSDTELDLAAYVIGTFDCAAGITAGA